MCDYCGHGVGEEGKDVVLMNAVIILVLLVLLLLCSMHQNVNGFNADATTADPECHLLCN